MKQAGQHRAEPKVRAGISSGSRTKMNASLAMVVCFVGFQGIVPQSWESASAVAPDQLRAVSTSNFTGDALVPTGRVGSSLLLPYGLDAFGPGAGTEDGFTWDGRGSDEAADSANGLSVTSVPGVSGPVKRPAEGMLFAPLDVLVPTSSFGFRTSPITGQADEFHTGQDYAAPCGTPVHAADAGTVRAVGWHPYGGGNRVEVDHGNGLITSYNHLEAISVSVGETVNGGQPIATVGTTGSSTGCHLHFETILDGEHVDPLRWTLQPSDHSAPLGALKDYTPGAGSASEIPAWAQSSTRSDQKAPADEADELVIGVVPALQLPASQSGAGTGTATDTAGLVTPGTPPAPPKDTVTPPAPPKEDTVTPPVPEGPKPPASVTPPAPSKDTVTPPAPPKEDTVTPPVPEGPKPPAPETPPVPPKDTVTPPVPEAPTPPAPQPTPDPTPVPVETDPTPEDTGPADSCDTDPETPESATPALAVDGAAAVPSTDNPPVAPSAGTPAVAPTTTAVAPSTGTGTGTPAVAPTGEPSGTPTTSDPAPCDDPEDPADTEESSSKAAPATEPTSGAAPSSSSDPAAVPAS